MEEMKWIPVDKRLPRDGEDCLITLKPNVEVGGGWSSTPDVYSADYCDVFSDMDGLPYNHFKIYGYNEDVIQVHDVLAWMPYPKPYTESCP